MNMHYCDIFSDCWRCPVAFCPYEKLDDDTCAGWATEEEIEEEQEEDTEDDGW